MIVTFNDGPHDLTAHPGLNPTLLPHRWFIDLYQGHKIVLARRQRIDETHPHNDIPHFHTLTRLMVRVRLCRVQLTCAASIVIDG